MLPDTPSSEHFQATKLASSCSEVWLQPCKWVLANFILGVTLPWTTSDPGRSRHILLDVKLNPPKRYSGVNIDPSFYFLPSFPAYDFVDQY